VSKRYWHGLLGVGDICQYWAVLVLSDVFIGCDAQYQYGSEHLALSTGGLWCDRCWQMMAARVEMWGWVKCKLYSGWHAWQTTVNMWSCKAQ